MSKGKEKEERVNPFFRSKESEFDGGDLTIKSPVGSIFGDYLHTGLNAMDTAIYADVPGKSKRSSSGKGAK
jgi:hypothetical protein